MILSIGIAAYLVTYYQEQTVEGSNTPRGVHTAGNLQEDEEGGAAPVAFWAIYSEKSTQVRSGVDLIKWEDQVNIREFRLYLVKCELEDWNGTWSATDDVSRVRKDASTDKYGH